MDTTELIKEAFCREEFGGEDVSKSKENLFLKINEWNKEIEAVKKNLVALDLIKEDTLKDLEIKNKEMSALKKKIASIKNSVLRCDAKREYLLSSLEVLDKNQQISIEYVTKAVVKELLNGLLAYDRRKFMSSEELLAECFGEKISVVEVNKEYVILRRKDGSDLKVWRDEFKKD